MRASAVARPTVRLLTKMIKVVEPQLILLGIGG
jgi:hypothetical protein